MSRTASIPTIPTDGARVGARGWAALAVLMLPVLLVSVDNTVLSFALPEISLALAPSGAEQLWIIDIYPLVLAGLLVTMGTLGDRFGRRRMLLIGATGFAAVSVLAAFAPTAGLLIAARGTLGFFGAMLMPSTLSLLRSIFVNRDQRCLAIAREAGNAQREAAIQNNLGWMYNELGDTVRAVASYEAALELFTAADDRGYLREEGIEVEFVEGDTAANAVPKVASQAFDVGYGDTNALIELAGASDERAPVTAVFATFNDSPYTIAVPAASAIREPRDLAGRRLGAHPNDAAMRMFPEFAAAAGLDAASVAIDICADPHRDMVARMVRDRAWDAMFGFVNTLRAASIEAGLDPAQALRFLEYRDVVPEL